MWANDSGCASRGPADEEVLGVDVHVVLTTDDVGDAHVGVVEGVREEEDRGAVRPLDGRCARSRHTTIVNRYSRAPCCGHWPRNARHRAGTRS